MNDFTFMLSQVFNSKKGEGTTETILAIILVLTFCVMMFFNKVIPAELVGIVSLVVGFYFGKKQLKYTKQKVKVKK